MTSRTKIALLILMSALGPTLSVSAAEIVLPPELAAVRYEGAMAVPSIPP